MDVNKVIQIGLPNPTVSGTAEVRDKDGNLKGTFTFGSLIDPEQADALYKQMKGDANGGHSDDSGA